MISRKVHKQKHNATDLRIATSLRDVTEGEIRSAADGGHLTAHLFCHRVQHIHQQQSELPAKHLGNNAQYRQHTSAMVQRSLCRTPNFINLTPSPQSTSHRSHILAYKTTQVKTLIHTASQFTHLNRPFPQTRWEFGTSIAPCRLGRLWPPFNSSECTVVSLNKH